MNVCQEWVETCQTCGTKLVPSRQWDRRLSREQRSTLKALGYRRKDLAGMCHTCRIRETKRRRSEGEEARSRYQRAEVLAEWELHADPRMSQAENARRLASRLGMKSLSLERAIQRARAERDAEVAA